MALQEALALEFGRPLLLLVDAVLEGEGKSTVRGKREERDGAVHIKQRMQIAEGYSSKISNMRFGFKIYVWQLSSRIR